MAPRPARKQGQTSHPRPSQPLLAPTPPQPTPKKNRSHRCGDRRRISAPPPTRKPPPPTPLPRPNTPLGSGDRRRIPKFATLNSAGSPDRGPYLGGMGELWPGRAGLSAPRRTHLPPARREGPSPWCLLPHKLGPLSPGPQPNDRGSRLGVLKAGKGAVEGLYGNLHGLGRKPSRARLHRNPASRCPWLPTASHRETLGVAHSCRRAPCFADSGAEPPSTSGLRPHDLPEGLVHGDAHGSGEVERPQAFPELGNPHTTLRPNGRVYLRRTAAALVPKE